MPLTPNHENDYRAQNSGIFIVKVNCQKTIIFQL